MLNDELADQMNVDMLDELRGCAVSISRRVASSGHANGSSSDDDSHDGDDGEQAGTSRDMARAKVVEPTNDTSVQTVTKTPKKRKKQDRRGFAQFGVMVPYLIYFFKIV